MSATLIFIAVITGLNFALSIFMSLMLMAHLPEEEPPIDPIIHASMYS